MKRLAAVIILSLILVALSTPTFAAGWKLFVFAGPVNQQPLVTTQVFDYKKACWYAANAIQNQLNSVGGPELYNTEICTSDTPNPQIMIPDGQPYPGP